MYAVVKTGGKQYRVEKGDVITVEKLEGEVGAEVDLGPALMTGEGEKVNVGAPTVEGSAIKGKIVAHGKGDKILIWKHRRRKDSRQKMGHRQQLTQVEITSIN